MNNATIGMESVTRDGGLIVENKPKTAVDLLVEEFGDDWPLEMVKMGHDDGGSVIEIYCNESHSNDLRKIMPHRYGPENTWTVILSVPEGYGADRR